MRPSEPVSATAATKTTHMPARVYPRDDNASSIRVLYLLLLHGMSRSHRTRFVVRRSSPGRGFGLFAREPMGHGEFLLEYTGRHVPTKDADELDTKYLFEIDTYWTVDGSSRSNTARYINHSCDPNCEADIRDGKILIFAMRAIAAGEELTIDYGDEYFDEFIKPYGCKCDVCTRTLHVPASH